MVNSLLLLLTINALEVGVYFGPILPTGGLSHNYKVTTAVGIFTSIKNFELGYDYSKFRSKLNTQEKLSLHTVSLSYHYPFYSKNNSQLLAICGTNCNRLIRRLETAYEKNSVFGLYYGLGFKQNFSISPSLRPSLNTQIDFNHIIQMRSWNYTKLLYSNLFMRITAGISFSFL